MGDRTAPNEVDDTYKDFVVQHLTLTPNINTPVNFSINVRAYKVKNWNTGATVLVKSSLQGNITGASDAAASPVGAAPMSNVPNVTGFPANAGNGLNLYSTQASIVTVEAYR